TKDITFTNSGTTAVTLNLAIQGSAVSPFSLAQNTVTIPAGAKETVGVTGDPTVPEYGRFGGWVVGTDAATGTPVTRTSLGMVKEEERYSLTIKLLDKQGKPASGIVVVNRAGD